MTQLETKILRKMLKSNGIDADSFISELNESVSLVSSLLSDEDEPAAPKTSLPQARRKAAEEKKVFVPEWGPEESDEPEQSNSLSLSSSIDSKDVPAESVDALYARVMDGLPDSLEVEINGAGKLKVAVEGWKKYSERSASSWTVDSAGYVICLANDRGVQIGRTMYYPGQQFDAKKDLHELIEAFKHRQDPSRGRVLSVRVPTAGEQGAGDPRYSMNLGDYSVRI